MSKIVYLTFTFLLFSAMNSWAQVKTGSTMTLDEMRDKYRLLLVFSPHPNQDSQFAKQMQILNDPKAELGARDVVVLAVPNVSGSQAVSAQEQLRLRSKFHVTGDQFTVVLVGKDGGEKFRSHDPVTIVRLNVLIDAMPMRQQEVRDGHHSK